jgi:hypothetical protein
LYSESRKESGKLTRESGKEEVPVKIKVEMDLGMHEAQGSDMTLKKDMWAETSTRPTLSGPTSTASEEPIIVVERLATKHPEEGKL